MTSLCPGPLFKSPGLNNYSTPSSRTDTPADINTRFSRIPFNGIPWPKASPVSKVYDVRNSSTRMILLNNKFSRKGCRLRGQTSNDGEVRGPDPDRHISETPHVNRRSHMDCADSSSPVYKPEKRTGLRWANASQRPPLKFEDGSSVNYKRHTTCMVSDDLRTMNWRRPRRPYSTSIIRESLRSRSPLLEDLSPGERLYMYSIARVYSVDHMRKQKQSQYCHLLHREVERGAYSTAECERYWKYLNSPRKTQQGPDDSFQHRRVKSAPNRRDKQTDRAQTGDQSAHPSERRSKSRASSRSMSRASSRYYRKSNDQNNHNDDKSDASSNQPTPSKMSNQQTPKKTPKSPKKSRAKYEPQEKSDQSGLVKRVPVESDEEESGGNEAQVRGQDKVKDTESSDSDEPTRESRHREGKDRPRSRLGGRKKDAIRNTDTSGDDYSSDSSDSSFTDRTTSLSKSTSEPTSSKSPKSSSPSKQANPSPRKETNPSPIKQAKPDKDVEVQDTKPAGEQLKSSSVDKKQDTSYSEDFTDTSASQSVSHAKGGNSDTKQSDSSQSETVTQSMSTSQSKTTSSDQTTSTSTDDHTKSSTAQKLDDGSLAKKSTEQSAPEAKPDDPTNKTSTEDTSKSESSTVQKSDEEKSRSDEKVKSVDEVKVIETPKVKVEEVKDDPHQVKASDVSYSDDFTESKSDEAKKPAAATSKSEPAKEDKDGRATSGDEKGIESSTNQRRDSIDLDSDDRVRDWDKIEY